MRDNVYEHEVQHDQIEPRPILRARYAFAPDFPQFLYGLREHFDVVVLTGRSGRVLREPLRSLGCKTAEVPALKGTVTPVDRLNVAGKRCLFADDFVAVGQTLIYVREAIHSAGGVLVGTCHYSGWNMTDPVELLLETETDFNTGRRGQPNQVLIGGARIAAATRMLGTLDFQPVPAIRIGWTISATRETRGL